ncbi:hypothetical protein Q7P37_006758 [Cladosporium fusiforme]
MSSSITTAVPSGLITTDWCVQEFIGWHGEPAECANSTLGQKPSDFGTICCAGNIIDTTKDMWSLHRNANRTVDLDNLVCCLVEGPQQGGIMPIAIHRTQCEEGNPTPLVSFAATNTDNAAIWEATYTSASISAGLETTVTGDFIPRETPTCLWVYTKTGVAMQNVTLPAADITTLPAPTTDEFGWPITTGTFAPSSSTAPSLTEDAATSATSTSGAASIVGSGATAWLLLLCLGSFHVLRS